MDSIGYVQYAESEAKAYEAIILADEEIKKKLIGVFR